MKASENPYEKFTVIPTGIGEIDDLTGRGGFLTRKITELFGMFSVGKTTIALGLVAEAQKLGMDVLWADSEFSWDSEYARVLGVDPTLVDLIHDELGDDLLNGIETWIMGEGEKRTNPHKNGLVVLDSIGMLRTRPEAENEIGQKPPATQARLVTSFVRNMKAPINLNNIALVLLNHGYNPMNFGAEARNSRYPTIQPKGGAMLEFAKDLSIFFETWWVRDDNNKIQTLTRPDGSKGGNFIRATVFKNKTAPTRDMRKVFALSHGFGVYRDWNLFERSVEKGTITRTGNTYWAFGEKLGTISKVREWIKIAENAERVKELIG